MPVGSLGPAAVLARPVAAATTKIKYVLLGYADNHIDDERGKNRTRAQVESLVKATLARIKKGAKFEELMKELSEDKQTGVAGDSVESTLVGLPPLIKMFATRLQVDEIAVAKTQFGVFIVRAVIAAAGLPYQLGTSDTPKFSKDGRWLVMIVRAHGSFTWYDKAGNAYEAQSTEEATWSLPWAEIYALRLPRAQLSKSMITLESKQPPENDPLEVYDRLREVTEDDFELTMPDIHRQRIDLPPSDETFELL